MFICKRVICFVLLLDGNDDDNKSESSYGSVDRINYPRSYSDDIKT